VSGGAAPGVPGGVELEGADANAIGRAVKELWKAAGADAGESVRRACVMNLVVVLAGEWQSGDTFRALDALAASHPARTVVVIPDAAMPAGGARSEVSIFCAVMPGPGRHVCAERIVLRAAADTVGHLHQTVLALCVDELERVVWWRVAGGDPTGILGRLAPHVDGLVVDSRDWARDASSPEAVLSMRGDAELPLRDLDWGRLTLWREMIAQAFDAAETRAALGALNRVRVGVAAGPDGAASLSALLLLGWLADRLGWHLAPTRMGEAAATVPCVMQGVSGADGRPVAVELVADAHPAAERGMVSVILRSESPRAEFSFARTGKGNTVAACTEAEGIAGLCRMVDFGVCTTETLLARELNYGGRDAGYERALANASRMGRMATR